MRGQDLLNALADELSGLSPDLAAAYDAGAAGDSAEVARAHDTYSTSVAPLADAAGDMGLAGVQRIAAAVLANLDHVTQAHDERVLVRAFFTDWAPLLESHLRD